MFVLVEVQDNVRVVPERFAEENLVIEEEINRKYANKILDQIGLVIRLFDVISVRDGLVHVCDGAANFTVHFRLVVFKPFIGEVITAVVSSCDIDGLWMSLHFFEDVHVPATLLRQDMEFDAENGNWVWRYTAEDDQAYNLDIQPKDIVRLRVSKLHFHPPTIKQKQRMARKDVTASSTGGDESPEMPAMEILASMQDDGLGPIHWWSGV